MKRGKFESQPVAKKNNGKKIVSLLLVLVLLLGAVVGSTLAWLSQKTETIKNTFTVGTINITLTEPAGAANGYNFKMTPGKSITKDPQVTVVEGSEACWLFVKIDEENDDAAAATGKLQWAIADGWTLVPDTTNVWYKVQAAVEANDETPGADSVTYEILKGNKVTISGDVTKDYLDKVSAGTEQAPALSFTAYAIQSSDLMTNNDEAIGTTGDDNAAKAWALVSGT